MDNKARNKFYNDKYKEKKAQYYEVHKERLKALRKIRYENNKEKCRAASKRWQENNPERYKEIGESGRLKRVYGMTVQDYAELLVKQKNSCAICKKHKSNFKRKLAVDHIHGTKINRGLLCDNCNIALGLVKENIYTLQNMIFYIQEYCEKA